MKRSSPLAILLLAIFSLLSGCSGLDYDTRALTTCYKPEDFSKIKSWSVKLAYANGALAGPNDADGYTRNDMILREDLYYALKDSQLVRIDQNGEGAVLISVDSAGRGGHISIVTVRIVDAKGEVLSRLKVQDMTADGLTNRKFTQYLAEHIIREITSPGVKR